MPPYQLIYLKVYIFAFKTNPKYLINRTKMTDLLGLILKLFDQFIDKNFIVNY